MRYSAVFSPFPPSPQTRTGKKNPHDLISPQVVTPEPFGDRRGEEGGGGGEKAAFMIEPREGRIERGKDSWSLQHNV